MGAEQLGQSRNIAIVLIFGVQSVDLRTFKRTGHYNAVETLSPMTAKLYNAMREVVGERPYIWNDNEQALEQHSSAIVSDIINDGIILQAIQAT